MIIVIVVIYGVFFGLSVLLYNITNGFINSPFEEGKTLDVLFEPIYPPLSAENLIKQLRAYCVIGLLPIPVVLIIFAITGERLLLQAAYWFVIISVFGFFYKVHGLSVIETIKTVEKNPEFARTYGTAKYLEAKIRARTPYEGLPEEAFFAPSAIENGYDYLMSYYTYGYFCNKGENDEARLILERMINATPSYIAQTTRDEIAGEWEKGKSLIKAE
jgi:hypothetical protein